MSGTHQSGKEITRNPTHFNEVP